MKKIFSMIFLLFCGCSDEGLELKVVSAPEFLTNISEIRTSKIILVNIWSTWCQPCIEEFPYVVGLEKKYDAKDLDVIFFSVDWDAQEQEAITFLKNHQVMGQHFRKREGDDQLFINTFSIEWTGAIPFTALYDQNGELAAQWEGKRSESYFYAKIDSLLTLYGS